jgi:CubicO group peptidase (beta-lactamase class C family)
LGGLASRRAGVGALAGLPIGRRAGAAKVRVKHLVCACTGLPRQDLQWIFQADQAQPSTVLTWLSTMEPTSDFGELYQYSNLMAGAAGYLGAHVLHLDRELGAAYDAAMQELVFDPLGMSKTTFDYAKAQAGNHAAPHALDITITPGADGYELEVAAGPEGRRLIIREAPRVYAFSEAR